MLNGRTALGILQWIANVGSLQTSVLPLYVPKDHLHLDGSPNRDRYVLHLNLTLGRLLSRIMGGTVALLTPWWVALLGLYIQ